MTTELFIPDAPEIVEPAPELGKTGPDLVADMCQLRLQMNHHETLRSQKREIEQRLAEMTGGESVYDKDAQLFLAFTRRTLREIGNLTIQSKRLEISSKLAHEAGMSQHNALVSKFSSLYGSLVAVTAIDDSRSAVRPVGFNAEFKELVESSREGCAIGVLGSKSSGSFLSIHPQGFDEDDLSGYWEVEVVGANTEPLVEIEFLQLPS